MVIIITRGAAAAAIVRSFMLACYEGSHAGNANNFLPLGYVSTNLLNVTEASVDITVNRAFTILRHTVNIQGNTKNANTTIAFRDDGADVAPLTVTNGVNGQFDSGAVSVAVAAGSLCNYRHSTAASAAGNIAVTPELLEIQT